MDCFVASLLAMTRKKGPIVKIVDLSRELYHGTPSYPGHPPVIHGAWKTHEQSFAESGYVHGLSSTFISMPDNAGTPIPAQRPFNTAAQPTCTFRLAHSSG